MTPSLPVLSECWIGTILAEFASIEEAWTPSAVEALTARLAAQAFSPQAPRAAANGQTLYRRHLLAGGGQSRLSCLLIEWPAAHRTPIHDHAGLWGIELVLDGALEVEEFRVEDEHERPRLAPERTLLLGAGDAACFTDHRYAHRCRNLSATRPALSLHVYGGMLDRYRTFQAVAGGGHVPQLQHARIDSTLPI